MYRVLLSEKAGTTPENHPLFGFDGVYSKNEIPFFVFIHKNSDGKTVENPFLPSIGEFYIELSISDIVRLESRDGQNLVFMPDNTFWTTPTPIEEFEHALKVGGFVRVHQNHLINVSHLQQFVKCNGYVTLSNFETIPVDTETGLTQFFNDRNIL
jgi:hypothetical protein